MLARRRPSSRASTAFTRIQSGYGGSVRRHGNQRSGAVKAARGGKCANAAHHCPANAGNRCDESRVFKKRLRPSQRKEALRALQAEGLSQRQACALVKCPRKTVQYRLRTPPEDPQLRERLKAIAEHWPRFGYRRLMIMVRREGMELSWWRLRKLYRLLRLEVRPQRKRHVRYVRGCSVMPVSAPNERWSIDFIHDRLNLGRPFRAMVVVDDFTRECLAIEVAFSFGSRDVIRVLEAIGMERGLAATMRFDSRQRVYQPRHAAVERRAARRAAIQRSGQTNAERTSRSAQRAHSRRAAQSSWLCKSLRRAPRRRALAHRVQRRSTPFGPWLSDAEGVRRTVRI